MAATDAEQDLEDLICDALQDSMDVDWTCRTGAAYVAKALLAHGLVWKIAEPKASAQ